MTAEASFAGTLPRELVPITKTEARQFIATYHRHNEPPSLQQTMFAVGLRVDGELVAVATAGRPVARLLDDGRTLEINRTCVRDYQRNANSMLYGAIARAAKALGYKRLVTYTLVAESGASLRACGWSSQAIRTRSWAASKVRVRHDETLWGTRKMTQTDPKFRWELAL